MGTGMLVSPMVMEGPEAEAEARLQGDQAMEEAGIIMIGAAAEAVVGAVRGTIGTALPFIASIRQ